MKALNSGYNRELDRIQDSFAMVRYCLSENVLSDRRLRQFFKDQADTRVAEVRQATIQTPGEKQVKEMAYR